MSGTGMNTSRAWALGGATFAGCMMIMVGIWQVLVGIAAIAKDGYFFVSGGYLYEFDTTTWGWIHLVIGALALVAGFFIFTGQIWARAVGIGLAVLSATVQFFWLPYQPLWSAILIAIDIFVIWALITMGEPTRSAESSSAAAGRGRDWTRSQHQDESFDSMNEPSTGGAAVQTPQSTQAQEARRAHETGPVGQNLPPSTGGGAGPAR
ncbi:hypothetical protein AB0I28_06985 [Phytomonospora sp. NPDC050363]|uniref:DUF7144 family membrane protein n=1 Tax=Phytomonospora sp. NPDC050363 TaxID=3155642 RepID=UPI003409C116